MSNINILSDAISRVNNAQKNKKKNTNIISSKLTLAIFKLLLKLGYIEKIKEITINGRKKESKIYLKYEGKFYNPVIKEFKIISKPGKKMYKGYKEIKRFYEGLGTIIISSSKGIITDYYAINNKIGGELLCKII